MVEAKWNGAVIARSDDTVVVEGNHYFPLEAVDAGVLKPSATTTVCGWKGTAQYYSLVVDGAENRDAAWYYAEPKEKAAAIKGRVAFWKGVTVGKLPPDLPLAGTSPYVHMPQKWGGPDRQLCSESHSSRYLIE
ncbi:MAG: hypothetical protein CFE35_00640 [Novosphingobium sp. PASSN1]|nr:MAG: hypothetical protein CFE35_00640 [Novosphingobium sp. PASSN1]